MSLRLKSTRWDSRLSPGETVRAWPRDRYLAALCSCPTGDTSGRWARWSYFTSPSRVVALNGDEKDPIARLSEEIDGTRLGPDDTSPAPFAGGWIVALSYELGRTIEPSGAIRASRSDADWPWSIVMWRCPWVLAYDHAESHWWSIDRGGKPDRRALFPVPRAGGNGGEYELEMAQPTQARAEFLRSVERVVEYIRAGDVFQVNLAHRLRAGFEGSPRALFTDLARQASPWYGAYLELAQENELHAALGVSPELLVSQHAPTRLLTTRPIKGTLRGDGDAAVLLRSEKDRAELTMIVDLMRNDIGRVCRPGTVRVADARAIERHGGNPGVHQGVATIHGTMRSDRSVGDLLRAVLPAGSITGAPKVRAMQIIEELEPEPRGLYTGAIGYISDTGDIGLNVSIRTAVVRGTRVAAGSAVDEIASGTLSYGVGAGIVADSVPELEWQETLDKAGVLWNLPTRAGTRVSSHVRSPQGVHA